MKTTRIITLLFLFILFNNRIFAQDEKKSIIKPFGIGLHIEQFKFNDITDFGLAPANKIVFVISPSKVFRIEPEIGFRSGKNKTNDLKNSGVYAGLGLLGMLQKNKLNILYGIRIEYASIKYESINNGFTGSKVTNESNRLSVGPGIGGEYFLGDNFAFGGEVGLRYAKLKSTEDPKPAGYTDVESSYISSDAGLFIRIYFGK